MIEGFWIRVAFSAGATTVTKFLVHGGKGLLFMEGRTKVKETRKLKWCVNRTQCLVCGEQE